SGDHDPKAYGERFAGKKVEKSLAKSHKGALSVRELPNAYRFDQIDHVSQLAHSKNPLDRLTLKALHHHGELQHPLDNGISDVLESFVKKTTDGRSSGSPAQLQQSEGEPMNKIET